MKLGKSVAIVQQHVAFIKIREKVALVAIFSCLTALGAHIYIPLPFTPVPITLQTFFVLFSGAFLGAELGSASQLLYLVLGILGIPVFAAGSYGLARIIGPTGGYLIGFVVSSFIVGKLLSWQRSSQGSKLKFLQIIFVFAVGNCIIYILGALQLKFVLALSLSETLQKGVIPFIFGDFAKSLAATEIYRRLQR
ncbi:MAG: biotin transporter BioY [Elusimicrobiota bacterium]|nr:biotin transporter BioY [Elusimicrobiota bacterium]